VAHRRPHADLAGPQQPDRRPAADGRRPPGLAGHAARAGHGVSPGRPRGRPADLARPVGAGPGAGPVRADAAPGPARPGDPLYAGGGGGEDPELLAAAWPAAPRHRARRRGAARPGTVAWTLAGGVSTLDPA